VGNKFKKKVLKKFKVQEKKQIEVKNKWAR